MQRTINACPYVSVCAFGCLLAEITADLKGQQEFQAALHRIDAHKADMEVKIAKNEKYMATFDEKIGPFEHRRVTHK